MTARMSPQKPSRRGGIALAGTIGAYFVLSLLGGLILGLILDRILHTAPWLLITGVVVGFIAAFYFTYRLAIGELGE